QHPLAGTFPRPARVVALSIDKRHTTLYYSAMIRSFKHRGLKALYEGRTERRVAPDHADRLRDILAVLDRSRVPDDMNLPGFRLHPLKGKMQGLARYGFRRIGG